MAHMFPETLQGAEVQSGAERLLFDRFQEQLSDHFTVIHSVAWLSIPREGAPPADGEADFIILHPRMGILIIEVKGGQIGFDGATGWYSVRRDGSQVAIKDPFQQARRNKYALKNKIRSLPNWQGPIPTLGHVVAFPDGVVDISDLGPDSDREMILLHTDLVDVENWVRRCLKFFAGDDFVAPGDAGLEILQRLLRKSWCMREAKLGERVGVSKTAIHHYTEEQFRLLDWIASRPRAAIRGCAGSGKTVLGAEKARRLADEGFKTLFTCYNRGLAEYLRHEAGKHPNLTILHFHGLCAKYAAETGYDQSSGWDSDRKDFYTALMPEALAAAADSMEDRYSFDAIVVDEGQDFQETWWLALEMLLRDRERGVFYIFYDDNQLVYPHQLELPIDEPPFSLTTNCRNTKQIHAFVEKYYRSDLELSSSALDGPEVQFHRYDGSGGELRALLTEILSRIAFEEEVSTREIVLLSPGGPGREPLSQIPMAGAFRFVDKSSIQPREIFSTTIRLFKGLERGVVVLLLEPASKVNDELIYVGSSRAGFHLEIISTTEID
jgi:hypothetical protein